jgi:hypothetical protein
MQVLNFKKPITLLNKLVIQRIETVGQLLGANFVARMALDASLWFDRTEIFRQHYISDLSVSLSVRLLIQNLLDFGMLQRYS